MKIHFPFPSVARALALSALLLTLTQCSVSEQAKEVSDSSTMSTEALENQAYSQMQFRLNSVDELSYGGQDIRLVREAADLTAPQQQQLQAALQSGSVPLHLRMRVFARNPTARNLQLKQLDYQVLVDGQEVATGTTAQDMALEASSIQTIPVAMDANLTAQQLGSGPAATYVAGLADLARPNRRLTVRLRPTYLSASGRESQAAGFEPVELVTPRAASKKR